MSRLAQEASNDNLRVWQGAQDFAHNALTMKMWCFCASSSTCSPADAMDVEGHGMSPGVLRPCFPFALMDRRPHSRNEASLCESRLTAHEGEAAINLTCEACVGEHADLVCDVLPRARGAALLNVLPQQRAHVDDALRHARDLHIAVEQRM